MKKTAGIISLIGCCVGIVICCVLMYKAIYLDIEEQEEFIASKEWELRERERELEFKELELIGIGEEKRRSLKQYLEVRKLMKQGYTHESRFDTETLSEKRARLSEEYTRISSQHLDLEMEISGIKESFRCFDDEFLDCVYTEDCVKGIQSAIADAQTVINDIRQGIPEVILMGFIGVSILALGAYYVKATRFGSMKPTVIQHLEKENNFIRKQIEKKELLVKLEHLEKE